MTWTPEHEEPEWLADLTEYQQEQARALALGVWPKEIALRERAISTTVLAAVASRFADIFAAKRRDGEIDTFPIFSSADLAYIGMMIESAILAGCWLQSQRQLEYLDNQR
jgi:hypothetical protein